ncbi:MAG: hypothetical protein V8Q79_06055 [Christensenellales bacterium]
MMESMRYIQKWKDIGMLDCSGSDASSDHRTREEFIKGNTLFMLGNQNGITETLGTEDEFGLMPIYFRGRQSERFYFERQSIFRRE